MSRNTEEDNDGDAGLAPVSRPADSWAKKLGNYALMALAPTLSALALVVATLALIGNRSGQDRLDALLAQTDQLNASLSATKGELDILKLTIAREKTTRRDDQKQMKEQEAEIVQHVSHLETKLKISPTLEEKRQAAASAAAATLSLSESGADEPAAADIAAAAPVPAPTPAAQEAAPKKYEKLSPQVRSIREAIDKFNQE